MVELEEMIDFILSHLVDDKSCYEVTTLEGDGEYTINVDIKAEEAGKVIGRNGKIAGAIRSLVRAYADKQHLRINFDIKPVSEVE